eukprot:jgi/Botrbrau1/16833/Bobra.150_2s0057.1
MDWVPLSWFALVLAVFHLSEFVFAYYTTKVINVHAFLISGPYILAMFCGVLEYVLEDFLVPGIKAHRAVMYVGLLLVLCGETIRKAGQIAAGGNFTHQLRFEKVEGHQLVTDGIYRYVRHPGYLGWFLWAVGTQIVLMNPACTLAFVLVVWRFFQQRITAEEYFLVKFFGEEYRSYRSRTPTLIPFIS